MTGSIKSRLEKLEQEQMFQDWFDAERLFESFNKAQLEEFYQNGYLSDPYPKPLPAGESRLDHLDRKSLLRMWQEHEREFGGRTREEYKFYTNHGHWPEHQRKETTMREGDTNAGKPQ